MFEEYQERGFEFERGLISVTTIIGAKDVFVKVDSPVQIDAGNFETTIKNFNVKLRNELGNLYDLMRHIRNQEIQTHRFDEDTWMLAHGAEIEIDKHKPYPDTVYKLKKYNGEIGKNFIFPFAIEGVDTTSNLIYPPIEEIKGFCVEEGGGCIINSDPGDCRAAGGFWHNRKPIECTVDPTFTEPVCVGENCNDCGFRKHGESWCVYDDIVGPGFDFSGTRHYKQSCVNGKIYNTECRDYRDEFCTDVYGIWGFWWTVCWNIGALGPYYNCNWGNNHLLGFIGG